MIKLHMYIQCASVKSGQISTSIPPYIWLQHYVFLVTKVLSHLHFRAITFWVSIKRDI